MTEAMLNGGAARSGLLRNDYPWLKRYPSNVDWFADLKGEPLPEILDRTVREFPNHTATISWAPR